MVDISTEQVRKQTGAEKKEVEIFDFLRLKGTMLKCLWILKIPCNSQHFLPSISTVK